MLQLSRGPVVESLSAAVPVLSDDDDDRWQPVYPRRRLTFPVACTSSLDVVLSSYTSLAPSDAVALLSGTDNTGLMQWSGSVAAAQWLLDHPDVMDAATLVIELGCGAGLLGVTCAMHYQSRPGHKPHVVCTDNNDECVALAQLNLTDNVSSVSGVTAVKYEWGEPFSVPFDGLSANASLLIVAGDVIYDATAPEALFNAVRAIHAALPTCRGLTFVLGFMPREWSEATSTARWRDVLERAASFGFVVIQTDKIFLADGTASGGHVAHFALPLEAPS